MAGIGKHSELLKTCAVYQEIVASQLTEKEADSL
jgi:ATP-binding cassette subfamily B protein